MEKLYNSSVLPYPAQPVVRDFLRVDVEYLVSILPGDEGKSGGDFKIKRVAYGKNKNIFQANLV